MGFFEKIKNGLKKTRAAMANTLGGIFASFSGANEEFYEELEESMILADIGVETSCKAVEQLRTVVKERKLRTAEEIHDALKDILVDMLNVGDTSLKLGTRPSVVLVIGVNGVGKTTTIGKLAHRLSGEGKRVLLCAADTFRAAAADQLKFGPDAPMWTSSASTRARTPPPWCSTPFPPPRREAATSSCATRQDACTTRPT